MNLRLPLQSSEWKLR